ncbi:potassium-transporting ATPase subunit KdpB [Staphylococcus ratti]|uniref:Potassium-transporting ATPase ATP-binding subunit n=1 Tax=Staphylococcus ratti TaxID=2892440 RepID=A0ABY3PD25_9STAP|nr:potassium-transporting ATPase subunit KdpB [Staphylococcus ratti]UEX90139.1 potassium-transporting ATPase subunit KdpB [Staphylococcus ratti]
MKQELLKSAIWQAFVKLNPAKMIKNPVMFVVLVTFFITVLGGLFPSVFSMQQANHYHWMIAIILFITLLFANFAESLAEGRGKAEANALRTKKKEMTARCLKAQGEVEISATELKKGDVVLVKQGETIPCDGEIIEGIAMVDESAITGESAPVAKESGGDFSSVIGGTVVVSDQLKIKVTAASGESFLDKMIALVEGASRQKTPNELALSTLLTSLTLIFLIVIVTLVPIAKHLQFNLPTTSLIALFICLIPTTIGGLLSAIGIAGMDRVTRFNVIAKSGKAVEACGDVDMMILDKTGTITFGNRMAHAFYPVQGVAQEALTKEAILSSYDDDTPEGRSIVSYGETQGAHIDPPASYTPIPFTAETRISGIEVDGCFHIKGAVGAVMKRAKKMNIDIPEDLLTLTDEVAHQGGTPLVVMDNTRIYGVIYLKDIVKPGLPERFTLLRKMGIETVMCTGDNPLTAASIAQEAGVDRFIAECKPEDKTRVIKEAQGKGKVIAMTGDGTNDAPALALANVGVAMSSGTIAAKEASNMIDLDSDPTKLIEIVEIGKQLLITRGALTTFSIANDIAKYFAIIPALFLPWMPSINVLNIMHLETSNSAILSALIFNAIIIPLLIPIALKGVQFKPTTQSRLLLNNTLIFGLGGIITPFIGIKLIDIIINLF